MQQHYKNLLFLKSAFAERDLEVDTDYAISWIKSQNEKINVEVSKINFKDLQLWSFDPGKTKLSHDTGKFFTIEGIEVYTNWGSVEQWSQPIINQPEIWC